MQSILSAAFYHVSFLDLAGTNKFDVSTAVQESIHTLGVWQFCKHFINKILFQWHASLGDISLHVRNHYVRQGLEYMNENTELGKKCLHIEDRKRQITRLYYREDNNEFQRAS